MMHYILIKKLYKRYNILRTKVSTTVNDNEGKQMQLKSLETLNQ